MKLESRPIAKPFQQADEIQPADVGQPDGSDRQVLAPHQPTVSNFVRHWRGELSLKRSFWINGLFLDFLFNSAWALSGGPGLYIYLFFTSTAHSGMGSLGVQVAYVSLSALFAVWQFVGIWRAAFRHIKETGKKFWSIIAYLITILAVFTYFDAAYNLLLASLGEVSINFNWQFNLWPFTF